VETDRILKQFGQRELVMQIASALFLLVLFVSIGAGLLVDMNIPQKAVPIALLVVVALLFVVFRCPRCGAFLGSPQRGFFMPNFDVETCRKCGVALMASALTDPVESRQGEVPMTPDYASRIVEVFKTRRLVLTIYAMVAVGFGLWYVVYGPGSSRLLDAAVGFLIIVSVALATRVFFTCPRCGAFLGFTRSRGFGPDLSIRACPKCGVALTLYDR
jgi:ribosomal protein S27AE